MYVKFWNFHQNYQKFLYVRKISLEFNSSYTLKSSCELPAIFSRRPLDRQFRPSVYCGILNFWIESRPFPGLVLAAQLICWRWWLCGIDVTCPYRSRLACRYLTTIDLLLSFCRLSWPSLDRACVQRRAYAIPWASAVALHRIFVSASFSFFAFVNPDTTNTKMDRFLS